ncbi:MAG: hypothetical protein JEY96_01535 [Bacteroidales bacterium]|nr:hypothetical protein [Bacteroidales bacterium]
METISGTEAVQQMRTLSKIPDTSFTLVHLTYDRKREKTKGKRTVESCRLRQSLPEDVFDVDSDHYLPYEDLNKRKYGQCFKKLIRFVGFPPNYTLIKVNWFDNDTEQ